MFVLALEQAKHALKAERLDEAAGLLTQADVRSHRDAGKWVDKLVQSLVARGHAHLEAGDTSAANKDLQTAQGFAANTPAVSALQQALAAFTTNEQHNQLRQRWQQHTDMAKDALGGHRWLNALPALQQAFACRKQADALGLLHAGSDWAALAQATQAHIESFADQAMAAAQGAWQQGDLSATADILQKAMPWLGDPMPAKRLQKALARVGQAGHWLKQGKPIQAQPVVQALAQTHPEAVWLQTLNAAVDQAAQAQQAILASPLGDWQQLAHCTLSAPGAPAPGRGNQQALANPIQVEPAATEPSLNPFSGLPGAGPLPGVAGASGGRDDGGEEALASVQIMEVNDGPTSQLVFGGRLTIGPAASKKPVAIGLLADPGLPVVELCEEDGDWLLFAERPVLVNGAPVKQALLKEGDKIAFGRQVVVRFQKPHPASATAVLVLLQGRLPRPDVRRVVLVADVLAIGPTAHAHVPTAASKQTALLKTVGGFGGATPSLGGPVDQQATVEGLPWPTEQALPVAKSVEVAGHRLRLMPVGG